MRRARFLLFSGLVVTLAALIGCGSSQPAPSPQPQQDFTLALSAKAVYVPIGAGNGSVQVSVQAVNGFNQSVSVSFSGLPTGVTTSPALPLNVNPGSNQTVTLMAASGTSPSLQNISVQATSGTLDHASSFSLSVANPSYAYLATGYPGQPPYDLVGFAVDANTGALSAVPGSPLSVTSMPVDLAVASETGDAFVFLLIPNSVSQTVALNSYSVDTATGALTPVQTINYPANTLQSSLAVHPSQKFLYVVQSGCILAYLIDPATGNLTQSSCSTLQLTSSLTVVPPGNFAYQVTDSPFPPTNWFIFSVDQSDGSLTLVQSYNSTVGGGALFTDPQGRALYETMGPLGMGACGGFVIWAIDPSSGALTNLNTSFSPLCEPESVTFNPADTFGYVSSGVGEFQTQNGIYAGTVNATNGNLTSISGSPFASGTGAEYGSVEPSQGKFLLQQSTGTTSGQVLVYAIESNGGALSQVTGVQGVLPSRYAYVLKMLTVAPNP